MYTLLIRQIPPAVETLKSGDPSHVGIYGSAVAERELIHRLLAHGTADRVIALVPRTLTDHKLDAMIGELPHPERIQLVAHDDMHRLRALMRVVVLAGDSRINLGAHVRSVYGRPQWVVSAVAHALSSYQVVQECMWLHLNELYAHDSFVCSSEAGAIAFRALLANAQQQLEHRLGKQVSCPLQVPIIPLPVPNSVAVPVEPRAARDALGLRRDSVAFLYMGRLTASHKADLGVLLMAFREVRAQVPESVLVLAGDDRQRESGLLQELANNLGVADAVHFKSDPTAEVKGQLYSAADVFVSLSDNLQETFGLTLLEAMAAGLPVIASNWSGHRDIVRDRETGFLIPTYWSDCVSGVGPTTAWRLNGEPFWVMAQAVAVSIPATVRAMVQLALDANLRRTMGERGRDRAQTTFSGPAIVERYERLWAASLETGHAAGLDGRPAMPPLTCDYFRTFGHYASSVVSASTVVRITSAGRQVLSQALVIPGFELDLPGFEGARLTALLSLVAVHDSVSIEALLRSTPSEDDLRHLLRLLKYGLIDLESSDVHAGEPRSGGRVRQLSDSMP